MKAMPKQVKKPDLKAISESVHKEASMIITPSNFTSNKIVGLRISQSQKLF